MRIFSFQDRERRLLYYETPDQNEHVPEVDLNITADLESTSEKKVQHIQKQVENVPVEAKKELIKDQVREIMTQARAGAQGADLMRLLEPLNAAAAKLLREHPEVTIRGDFVRELDAVGSNLDWRLAYNDLDNRFHLDSINLNSEKKEERSEPEKSIGERLAEEQKWSPQYESAAIQREHAQKAYIEYPSKETAELLKNALTAEVVEAIACGIPQETIQELQRLGMEAHRNHLWYELHQREIQLNQAEKRVQNDVKRIRESQKESGFFGKLTWAFAYDDAYHIDLRAAEQKLFGISRLRNNVLKQGLEELKITSNHTYVDPNKIADVLVRVDSSLQNMNRPDFDQSHWEVEQEVLSEMRNAAITVCTAPLAFIAPGASGGVLAAARTGALQGGLYAGISSGGANIDDVQRGVKTVGQGVTDTGKSTLQGAAAGGALGAAGAKASQILGRAFGRVRGFFRRAPKVSAPETPPIPTVTKTSPDFLPEPPPVIRTPKASPAPVAETSLPEQIAALEKQRNAMNINDPKLPDIQREIHALRGKIRKPNVESPKTSPQSQAKKPVLHESQNAPRAESTGVDSAMLEQQIVRNEEWIRQTRESVAKMRENLGSFADQPLVENGFNSSIVKQQKMLRIREDYLQKLEQKVQALRNQRDLPGSQRRNAA